MHISELTVDSYRGLIDLELSNLGKVNIIVGENNAGKTSLLEAIQLFCTPTELGLVEVTTQKNTFFDPNHINFEFYENFRYLFPHTPNKRSWYVGMRGVMDSNQIVLSVTGDFNEVHLSETNHFITQKNVDTFSEEVNNLAETPVSAFSGFLDYTCNDIQERGVLFLHEGCFIKKDEVPCILPPVKFISNITHNISNSVSNLLQNENTKEKAVTLLQKYNKNIKDIVSNAQGVFVLETVGRNYIPLGIYGIGMIRTLSILNILTSTKNGIILIDEVETSLHTSVMEDVFQFIIETARELNVQLFLTTHSMEAIDKLLAASGKCLNDVRIVRLKQKAGKTYAQVTSGLEAIKFRENYGMELRG